MPSPPIPSALRALRGNVGHRKVTPSADGAPAKIPPCPRELDADARKVWRSMGRLLLEAGLIASVDGPAFAAFCVTYARWLAITESLRDAPLWVERANGQIEPNPALRLQAEAQRDYLKALEGFGGTPAWRSRITTKPQAPTDELGDWLKRA